jgi:hypothetical protein
MHCPQQFFYMDKIVTGPEARDYIDINAPVSMNLKAIAAAKFDSVRGAFKFNTNGYPIQDYYLRVITKDAQGRITNRTLGTVFKDHADAYVGQCKMPAL